MEEKSEHLKLGPTAELLEDSAPEVLDCLSSHSQLERSLLDRESADGGVESLYDLSRDPYEQRNLAAERQHAAVLEHMVALARQWAKQTGDPFPNPAAAAKAMYSDDEARRARP